MGENIIGYLCNGEIKDTQSIKEKDSNNCQKIEFNNSKEALEIIRHSTAHLMAQAIKELYPDSKFFVGPVVDEGFYYDFKTSNKIGEEDLKKIEKKMKDLVKKKFEISKYEISKSEAVKKFENDELKQKVLENIPSETVSIYKQGDFEDLCRGPHLPNIKFIRNFKLQE